MNTREQDIWRHVECDFVLRELKPNGYHRFTPIGIRGPRGDGRLRTTNPPLVGDGIWLSATDDNLRGSYVVIARDWMHASWGSMVFPIGEGIQDGYGTSLSLLVERTGPGWYATEDPEPEPEEDEGDDSDIAS